MTRRDLCHLIGKRADKLSPAQAALAWKALAEHLMALGELDTAALVMFKDLARAIRQSTIAGTQADTSNPTNRILSNAKQALEAGSTLNPHHKQFLLRQIDALLEHQ